MFISRKSNRKENKRSKTRPPKSQMGLAEYKSLLYSRNKRRYQIMSLTAISYGFTITCSSRDTEESNEKFYSTYTEFASIAGTEPIDEIDRQQMKHNDIVRSGISATYIRAVQLAAAERTETVLNLPISPYIIPLIGDGIQLTLDADLVCTLVFRKRINVKKQKKKDKDEIDRQRINLAAGVSKQPTRMVLRDSVREQTCKTRKENRLAMFDDPKRRCSFDDVETSGGDESLNVTLNDDEPMQVDIHQESRQTEIVDHVDQPGTCRMRKTRIRPQLREVGEPPTLSFNRCRTIMIHGESFGSAQNGAGMHLCPCCTILGHSIELIELRGIKYVLNHSTPIFGDPPPGRIAIW